MISAKLGHFLDKPLAPIAKRVSINPNIFTFLGFFITIGAAFTIPSNLTAGGILILIGGFFDMFDGIVARANGKNTKFGAFLDSTLDRYSDSGIFLAIAWYFFEKSNLEGILLTIGSLVGSLLISYVRARAEGLGIDCHVGLIERPERVVLLALGCLTGWLFAVILILFILSHITVIQRVWHVYKKAC
ncbi:MAG: CDP-alcohol phosphatidyltransferase family protein [Thermodesulfovibrio sp.]|nr:CDP-alcohol phosphatidyltransferase family protein [Thermodesulfovibrio sp.]